MKQHTPGPWKVISGAVYTLDERPIAEMVRDKRAQLAKIPAVERDENARFVARAPDMEKQLAQLRQDKAELLEAIKRTAADRAYIAGLGAGEWEAFLNPHEAVAIAKAGKGA